MTDSPIERHPAPLAEPETGEPTWYDEEPEVVDDETPRSAAPRPLVRRKPLKRPEPRRRFVDE